MSMSFKSDDSQSGPEACSALTAVWAWATPSNRVSVLHLLNGDNTHAWKWKSLSRAWLCDPIDYTVHAILRARIMEWVAFPFSRGSSQPRDQTQVSHIAGGFFTSWATREAQEYRNG